MITKFLIFLMKMYQRFLSPDHSFWAKALNRPPHCKHIPTCSQYMIQALEQEGWQKGFPKGIKRVLKCNPRSKGGYDPVDKEEAVKLKK